MSRLSLYLLGPPRVEKDGEPVTIQRRKSVALLAYLAVTRGSHTRDALATLFWPEYDHSRARASLRSALTSLKRALGEGWLHIDRENICLNTHPSGSTAKHPRSPERSGGERGERMGGATLTSSENNLWLDVTEFQDRLAECHTHSHPTDQVCSSCLDPLAQAVALYRDDFMAGFTLPDCPAFDEWQFFQSQGLREALASVLERLAHGHGAQGEYDEAIRSARRWVALDPLHEPAQRQLMLLYAWSNQRAAALRQYAECARVLQEELGLPPDEETTQLFQAIKKGVEPDAPAQTLLSMPAVSRRHKLPPQTTPLVGREAELAHIARRLNDPVCRLLTLAGPGGIGKTRLAIAAAERQLDSPPAGQAATFLNGVFFVPLAPVSAADSLVSTIASVLDFPLRAGPEPEQLLEYLREKELLLVLDNFEQLLAEVDLVTEILAVAPRVKVLVTSREALNLKGEWLYRVGGLPGPAPDQLEGELTEVRLKAYEAVDLFAQCARRARPGFSVAQEGRAVARICHAVRGMPLGIELAAAWLRLLPPAKIAEEIERGLDILTTSMRDVSPRHRSMRAVFDHTWNLLTAGERTVLQVLSVFRGGFSLTASDAVAGASLTVLASLVDKSLLDVTSAGHYEMHELFRQYVSERLAEDTRQRQAARDQHCTYYATALPRWETELKGSGQKAALTEMMLEIENARAAWNWAVQQMHAERLNQMIDGLCRFYERRGRFREGESACRLAVEKLGELRDATAETLALAKALAWRGTFCRLQGSTELGRQLLERSLNLLERLELRKHDTRSERAAVLVQLGHVRQEADREQARQLYERSLALYQELDDRWGTANALNALGGALQLLSLYDEANRLREEALAIRRALDDQIGIADSLLQLGWVVLLQGHFEKSEPLIQESLAIRQELGDRTSIAEGLAFLGVTRFWRGGFSEAEAVLKESVAANTKLGSQSALAWSLAWSNIMLGLAKAHQGQYESARAWAQKGLILFQKADLLAGIGHAHLALGHIVLAEGAYAEAQSLLREAVAIYREIGQRDELCWALADLGVAARGLGDTRQARRCVYEAAWIATETPLFFGPLIVLPVAALLLTDQGENERAVELYALASRYSFVAHSCWQDDVIKQTITAAAATLPPDVVTAAQERGRARDVKTTVKELVPELELPGISYTLENVSIGKSSSIFPPFKQNDTV
jgi:predicted ATPase/DNA-binding SARP family transcriptional activator